jgi:hypothetical protein
MHRTPEGDRPPLDGAPEQAYRRPGVPPCNRPALGDVGGPQVSLCSPVP